MPDGKPIGEDDARLGGQAVLEGVMIRGVGCWAVAVRRPAGEISIVSESFVSASRRNRWLRLPVVRGLVALAESMRIGFRALAISADAQAGGDGGLGAAAGDDRAWGLGALLVLGLAIALFFVLPAAVTVVIGVGTLWLFLVVETLLRIGAFSTYVAAINRSAGLRRTLEYHGAEHKAISCHEAGDALVPARAELYSRLHPRCGTSFLFALMVVATLVYIPVGLPEWHWLLLSRVLGVPVAVGISYEAIKWAGKRRRSSALRPLMRPGLILQRLTTREPDREQLAVAIAALERVLSVERAEGGRVDDDVEIVA